MSKSPTNFYNGHVSHKRIGTVEHRLNYKIAYILIDLDKIEVANRQSRFLGVNAFGLMSFQERDHGDGSPQPLNFWVRQFLEKHDINQTVARIELLTLPRMFGFVFNPISFYFVYDDENHLHHIIYEVNNTFGERHFYLCETNKADTARPHGCDKEFFVSPFYDVKGRYQFTTHPPGDTLAISIEYQSDDQSRSMIANLTGQHMPVTDKNVLRLLVQYPFMTIGVLSAIVWEAIKLKFKGLRYRPHRRIRKHAHVTLGFPTSLEHSPKHTTKELK